MMQKRLKRLLSEAVVYGLNNKTEELGPYDLAAQYLLDHGVRVCSQFAVPVYTEEELAKKYGKPESVRTN